MMISAKPQQLLFYRSPETNAHYNLAVEEHLLSLLLPGQVIIYLWQNQRTVVLGRNQNCWQECRVEQLLADGGQLARRLSGGGAVWHDLGNLNFTFLAWDACYNLAKQQQVIIQALAKAGISAQASGRNDLLVGDKKISGNAFYRTAGRCFHHGTILVDVDMASLARYLQPPPDKLASKGIKSVRARVANLRQFAPQLTTEQLIELLQSSFSQVYGLPVLPLTLNQPQQIKALVSKYSSWEWLYGKQGDFEVSWQSRFAWGSFSLNLILKQGLVKEAIIYSDAMDSNFIQQLALMLPGICYQKEELIRALQQAHWQAEQAMMIDDICAFVADKLG